MVPRTIATITRKAILFGAAASALFLLYGVVLPDLDTDHWLRRYLDGHPIERWTAALFLLGCAFAADRFLRVAIERHRLKLLRRFIDDVDLSRLAQRRDAADWLNEQLGNLRFSMAGRRVASMASPTGGLRDPEAYSALIRDLAEFDLDSLERSNTGLRFIAWAIPILGFLGTVLGITAAIAHVTPEQLENSLGEVTSGLAVAFDTTALALALSIGLMAVSSAVDRLERHTLSEADRFARFDLHQRLVVATRTGSEEGRVARELIEAAVAPVREVWEEERQRWAETVRNLATHQTRLLQEASSRMLEELRAHNRAQNESWVAAAQQAVQALDKVATATADRLTKAASEGAIRLSAALDAAVTAFKALATAQQETFTDASDRLATTLTEAEKSIRHVVDLARAIRDTLQQTNHLATTEQLLRKNLETLVQTSDLQETVQLLAATVQLMNARVARLTGENAGASTARQREAA